MIRYRIINLSLANVVVNVSEVKWAILSHKFMNYDEDGGQLLIGLRD